MTKQQELLQKATETRNKREQETRERERTIVYRYADAAAAAEKLCCRIENLQLSPVTLKHLREVDGLYVENCIDRTCNPIKEFVLVSWEND